VDEKIGETYDWGGLSMDKLWIQNSLNDRIVMVDKTVEAREGMVRQAVEKDWWVTVILRGTVWRTGGSGKN